MRSEGAIFFLKRSRQCEGAKYCDVSVISLVKVHPFPSVLHISGKLIMLDIHISGKLIMLDIECEQRKQYMCSLAWIFGLTLAQFTDYIQIYTARTMKTQMSVRVGAADQGPCFFRISIY